jgi:VanZ family protein
MAYVTSDADERRRAWSIIAMAVISVMLWAVIIESARVFW